MGVGDEGARFAMLASFVSQPTDKELCAKVGDGARSGAGATKGHSNAATRRSSLANFPVVLQNIDVFQMLALPALFLLSGQA